MEQDCVNAGTIAKLCDKIQKLESERDALKAHVERLRGVIDYCMSYLAENRLNTIGSWSKAHKELQHALESTPQQNLAERDAEESKRHFMYGYHFCRANGFLFDEQLQEAANEYAERIKSGGNKC